MGYKLHEGQKILRIKFQAFKSQLFVGECSRQFGKSYWMCVEATELAMRKPGAKIKYGTAFHTDLVEFILPNFEAIFEDCPDDIKPKYIAHKSKWVFHNGSEIKLVGLDRKPNGLRGTAIDLIILDEAGFISNLDYLYKSVIIPATTHRPECRVVLISTPPSTPAHEFLDYVQKAELEGGHHKFTIYDNPMVDSVTIARLMKESGGEKSTTWRREYLCEHVTDENLAIVPKWDDKYWVEVPRDVYYPFYYKYDGMDLGVSDNTAVIFGYYDFRRASLLIEDEFVINGPTMTTDILQAYIKDKELSLWREGYVSPIKDRDAITKEEIKAINELWADTPPKLYQRISDNNNPLLLQDLSFLHKLHFTATDKGSLEEMVNATKMLVDDGRLIVHPRCKYLRGCLKYGVWDKNRIKFAKSKVYGHFDALAALIYLVRNLNKSTNPIPPGFQLDPDNQILFLNKQESSAANGLKAAFGLKR